MSRLAKQPIILPSGVTATFDGSTITVTGKKGTLTRSVLPDVIGITLVDNVITLTLKESTVFTRSLWGTYAAHIRNMITGVTEGYIKKLEVEGVGYKWDAKSGTTVDMQLGFSHPINMPIPEGLTITTEGGKMSISGIDKELVGMFAAKIRSLKKPEPYKGKGIRYEGEKIRRKQGKRAV